MTMITTLTHHLTNPTALSHSLTIPMPQAGFTPSHWFDMMSTFYTPHDIAFAESPSTTLNKHTPLLGNTTLTLPHVVMMLQMAQMNNMQFLKHLATTYFPTERQSDRHNIVLNRLYLRNVAHGVLPAHAKQPTTDLPAATYSVASPIWNHSTILLLMLFFQHIIAKYHNSAEEQVWLFQQYLLEQYEMNNQNEDGSNNTSNNNQQQQQQQSPKKKQSSASQLPNLFTQHPIILEHTALLNNMHYYDRFPLIHLVFNALTSLFESFPHEALLQLHLSYAFTKHPTTLDFIPWGTPHNEVASSLYRAKYQPNLAQVVDQHAAQPELTPTTPFLTNYVHFKPRAYVSQVFNHDPADYINNEYAYLPPSAALKTFLPHRHNHSSTHTILTDMYKAHTTNKSGGAAVASTSNYGRDRSIAPEVEGKFRNALFLAVQHGQDYSDLRDLFIPHTTAQVSQQSDLDQSQEPLVFADHTTNKKYTINLNKMNSQHWYNPNCFAAQRFLGDTNNTIHDLKENRESFAMYRQDAKKLNPSLTPTTTPTNTLTIPPQYLKQHYGAQNRSFGSSKSSQQPAQPAPLSKISQLDDYFSFLIYHHPELHALWSSSKGVGSLFTNEQDSRTNYVMVRQQVYMILEQLTAVFGAAR